MDAAKRVDVAIVGAGTAGLSALREVRKETENFVVINAGSYGTTCARVGCMPSKALIAAANAFHDRTKLGEFGIRGSEKLSVEIPAVMQRVRTLRDHFVAGVRETTDMLGERNLPGHARLDGPNRLVVGKQTIEARRIVLATGSSPVVPKPWRAFGDRVLTTDTLFEQDDLPPRIAVIGLGAIGVEMAQALARLGIEVHGFDAAGMLAGLRDEKVAEALRAALAAEFPVHLGAEVELAETQGGIEVRWDSGAVTVDKVLAAMGRRPNVQGLGLETLGVPLDEKGLPEVDPTTARIGDTPVFLAGDANGDKPILHESADDGHIAGLNAVRDAPVRLERRVPIGIVFSSPEAAFVGRRADEFDRDETLVGAVDFGSQGRARTMQQNRGLLRVYARRGDGRVLGAEMAAPAAEHIAQLLAFAIGEEATVHDLLRMPFYHPTIEEGLRSALRAISRDLPECSISDLARCGPLGAEALE